MLVKHVTQNKIDVFFDSGWENWCRFDIVRVKNSTGALVRKLQKVGGKAVPAEIYSFLCKKFNIR
jgi:hypothetical protein